LAPNVKLCMDNKHNIVLTGILRTQKATPSGWLQLVDTLSTSCFGLPRRMQISFFGARRRTKVRQRPEKRKA